MILVGAQGYTPNPEATEAFVRSLPPVYAEQVSALTDEADDGRDCLNYRYLTGLIRQYGDAVRWINDKKQLRSRNQNPAGTCVGFGTAMALDVSAAGDIVVRNEPERFAGTFSATWCYGASRDISGNLGRRDGSYGGAAAKAIREWGTLLQVGELEAYDFERARDWARRGVPEGLKLKAAQHKVVHTARLKSVEQAWSCIGNCYPFNMCSNVGWERERDSDGAIRRSRKDWAHSMSVTSRRTTSSGRRLFLVHQSWGDNWTKGPYFEDQPLGSFWADWDDVDRAVLQSDSFTYSGYEGFISRRPDHTVL